MATIKKSEAVRHVLQTLIDISSRKTTEGHALGKNAGHFFIKELRNNIETSYTPIIQNMGLDLSLMQLEHEVNELERNFKK